MKKIVYCEIRTNLIVNVIFAVFDNGTIETLYCYHPNELSFRKHEFIGLTRLEALNLIYKRENAYLRKSCYSY